MIIFTAGVPRSGTVLVSAVLRALYGGIGKSVTLTNPHGAELPDLLRALIESRRDRHQVTLIHTHSWDIETERLLAGTSWATGFLNRRDPRDVCVSIMRLHDLAFDDAVALVLESFVDFFDAAKATSWPVIDYNDLIAAKTVQIRRIADHLGFAPTTEELQEIEVKTSIEKHKAIMERVRAGDVAHLNERRNQKRVLREDGETLINDRHIQSGVPGRWRAEMSPDQKERANVVFADLLEANTRGQQYDGL